MYTKEMYKAEIQQFIQANGYDLTLISKETFNIAIAHRFELDKKLRDALAKIASMGSGSELKMTEEEFNEFIERMDITPSYTKEMYIKEIKDWIKKNGYDAEKIGNVTFEISIEHGRELSHKLYDTLLYIAAMEGGAEFEMSEQEFYEFLQKM